MSGEEKVPILQKLLSMQSMLKVEKKRFNSFGNFMSRSKEDILEAAKPFAHELGCVIVCNDEIVRVDDGWVYVKCTATLADAMSGETVSATSYAREPEKKPKMDESQTTGSAASYAGKRALGNLFAIDDTADSDQNEQPQQDGGQFVAACMSCGTQYLFDSEEQMRASACSCGCRMFARV